MMRRAISITLLIFPCIVLAQSLEPITPYQDSTMTWENSPLNFNNSSLDWNNSPLNWQNSTLNPQSDRSVYDSQGNRQGYIVPTPSGAQNLFDNSGNRQGYIPAPEKK